jgi:hypothetical protein
MCAAGHGLSLLLQVEIYNFTGLQPVRLRLLAKLVSQPAVLLASQISPNKQAISVVS